MKLSVALVNLKPGVGKTTTAVWLAHAFHHLGHKVLYVDADPSRSGLEWSDGADGFPFRIISLPTKELHRRVPEFAHDDDVVVIDVPQMEDHRAIALSAIRLVDEVVIPIAPHPIEVARMAPVIEQIADMDVMRKTPARVSVVLNRVVKSTGARRDTREVIAEDMNLHVLKAEFRFVTQYSQSFPNPIPSTAGTEAETLAQELLERAGVLA